VSLSATPRNGTATPRNGTGTSHVVGISVKGKAARLMAETRLAASIRFAACTLLPQQALRGSEQHHVPCCMRCFVLDVLRLRSPSFPGPRLAEISSQGLAFVVARPATDRPPRGELQEVPYLPNLTNGSARPSTKR